LALLVTSFHTFAVFRYAPYAFAQRRYKKARNAVQCFCFSGFYLIPQNAGNADDELNKVTRLLFMLALSTAASAQEWQFYGGDAGGTRSSPLKQINRQTLQA